MLKEKPIAYTGAFVEFYKWRNCRQVYEIYGIVELEMWYISIIENLHNLSAYRNIEVSSVLRSVYVVPRD